MGYPIDRKLVIGVASSALFDLEEPDRIFREYGEDEYRKFQRSHVHHALNRGVAFPFIRRYLGINDRYPEQRPVEVVLLSHNDPDTGQRVFNSIRTYGLDITRAAFLRGKSPYPYIEPFNVSLFLSANERDVSQAVGAGFPAGQVIPTTVEDDSADAELRIAFDFDGVIADDEAEAVYAEHNNLDMFQQYESEHVATPHSPGPLADLFRKLSFFQKLEKKREREEVGYERLLRIAIVTARNAPAHERMITTLRDWGISPDETFFLGGIDKARILGVLKPHIFFDDQMSHIASVAGTIPSVHIPFGVRNVDDHKAIEQVRKTLLSASDLAMMPGNEEGSVDVDLKTIQQSSKG